MFSWFGWQNPAKITLVGTFYAAGLGLGLLFTLQADVLFVARLQNRVLRFIVLLIVALCLVVAFTAGLLAVHYRFYYAQWHEPFLTKTWMFQLFFTAVGAVAQYGIFGIRYHGIGALVIIFATCWWATRSRH